MTAHVLPGRSHPLGATVVAGGVNFSVYSRDAESLELLLFEADDPRPRAILLDRRRNRTSCYWHVFVPRICAGQVYGLRARGPSDPTRGLRFDVDKVLLDPYARAVNMSCWDRRATSRAGGNAATAMKAVVVDPAAYDWEGDEPLRRPIADTVIYEMHVKGLTRDASSGLAAEKRGTYAGVVEKIPYLKDLGITAVELLPVFQFDPQDAPDGLTNYWGYSPVSFFAPHSGYSSSGDPLAALDEFRGMVKALHRAGIEVILDVVYNHTAEGGADGPTISFRGLGDGSYYILQNGGAYADYTGTGHTVNANHPVVRRMILDSLVYWVEHMHVDGFRFDLASILTRDEDGTPMEDPPVLWAIDTHPVLAGTKIIAEAWDTELFQVGSFAGDRFHEWCSYFRDDVRRFLRGDPNSVSRVAPRLLGCPDLFENGPHKTGRGVNFVTCHDGFTLEDLVSYEHKHNEANREGNRDGVDQNYGWNCGVEGQTDDPEVELLRNRQAKNFLTILLLSPGTPMLLMGDEMRRTQGGNNNAYCQDNETSWLDWRLLARHRDFHDFVKRLIQVRGELGLCIDQDMSTSEALEHARIRWHGIGIDQPDWAEWSQSLACTRFTASGRYEIHMMLNAYRERLCFSLPATSSGRPWHRLVDTRLPRPSDCRLPEEAPAVMSMAYEVREHSVAVLVAEAVPSSP